MKKVFTLIVCLAMVLSLCACKTEETPQFLVGYAKEDITPMADTPVPLAGYGNTDKRMSTGFKDRLYITCVAMTDANDNTLLMFSGDTIGATLIEKLRPAVSAETGIPEENISLTATHTHSGPDVGQTGFQSIQIFINDYVNNGVKAARKALEDRKAAKMYYATIETEGLNFIRHYYVEDGTAMGDNFGDQGKLAVSHTSENDPTMHLIKFTRGEGNKDVLLMNWRAHPSITGGSTKYDISADFVGSVREYLEKELNCEFAYFQGAAGNVNPRSRITEEDCTKDYKLYGQQLGSFAIRALKDAVEMETGPIKIVHHTFVGTVNHTEDYLIKEATEIRAYWSESGDSAKAKEMGEPYGIRNALHAGAIKTRYNLPETQNLELYGFAIGDQLAFVTAPNELFADNAQYVEDNSVFEHTIVLGYSNGSLGYMPSDHAFVYTSYETDATRFVRGTAELISAEQLTMLQELKGQ